jgi:hypothetical protein
MWPEGGRKGTKEMGANYVYPGSGTVAATAPQADEVARQIMKLTLGTADTTIVLTHNWGFNTAELALLSPNVIITPTSAGSIAFGVSARAANTVTLAGTVTTAGTVEVYLDKPHSILCPHED